MPSGQSGGRTSVCRCGISDAISHAERWMILLPWAPKTRFFKNPLFIGKNTAKMALIHPANYRHERQISSCLGLSFPGGKTSAPARIGDIRGRDFFTPASAFEAPRSGSGARGGKFFLHRPRGRQRPTPRRARRVGHRGHVRRRKTPGGGRTGRRLRFPLQAAIGGLCPAAQPHRGPGSGPRLFSGQYPPVQIDLRPWIGRRLHHSGRGPVDQVARRLGTSSATIYSSRPPRPTRLWI